MGTASTDNVVFLDRDGVINQDSPQYIKSWSEFEFIPGSLDALAALNRSGFEVIIITNQSAVQRGLISMADLDQMHAKMQSVIQSRGGRILDIFFCPHLPTDDCSCRKPRPGMIERACNKYGIDPATTTMVGDSTRDIECARNAGCARAALVRTGYGQISLRELKDKGVLVDFVAENLSDAVQWILRGASDNVFGR